jgi:hypothetical protein
MRSVTIDLPDEIEIDGASDAPLELRVVPTENWNGEFCLAALIRGVSQKIGDAWSVSKKDVEKTKNVWQNMAEGNFVKRANSGITQAKLAEKVARIDVKELLAMLTPAQHAAILAAGGDISVVTTKQK